jgi:FlaG/FlaF family flagellin (archaellin)
MRPVVGIALMVAITVILACVIAAFVYGMAGRLPESNQTESNSPIKEETFKVVEKIHVDDRYIVMKQESLQTLRVTKEDYEKIQVDRFYNFKVYDQGAFQSYLYKVDWETS